MRRLCLFLTIIAGQALAQEVPEVQVPPGVEALMAGTVEPGDQLAAVSGWAVDADGDGDLDLIVEVASNPIGGNAVWVVPYILRNTGGAYEIAAKLNVNGWISGLRIEGDALTITTQTYLPNDPRCCPSGTEIKAFALR